MFPQFSWYLRKRRNQIKTTQRDAQRSDKCGERRKLGKLRIRLSAGISIRLLTYFYRMGQQRNIHKSSERERELQKAKKVTISVKCCSKVP